MLPGGDSSVEMTILGAKLALRMEKFLLSVLGSVGGLQAAVNCWRTYRFGFGFGLPVPDSEFF